MTHAFKQVQAVYSTVRIDSVGHCAAFCPEGSGTLSSSLSFDEWGGKSSCFSQIRRKVAEIDYSNHSVESHRLRPLSIVRCWPWKSVKTTKIFFKDHQVHTKNYTEIELS